MTWGYAPPGGRYLARWMALVLATHRLAVEQPIAQPIEQRGSFKSQLTVCYSELSDIPGFAKQTVHYF